MKPEQRVWRYGLKPALQKIPGLEYERVELSTGSNGTPDVYLSYGGSHWIENKYSALNDMIDLRGWRSGQRTWAKRHTRCGANVWLFIGAPGGYFLVDPASCWNENVIEFGCPAVVAWWRDQVDHRELAEILRSRNA